MTTEAKEEGSPDINGFPAPTMKAEDEDFFSTVTNRQHSDLLQEPRIAKSLINSTFEAVPEAHIAAEDHPFQEEKNEQDGSKGKRKEITRRRA